jgi:hypothetical protein
MHHAILKVGEIDVLVVTTYIKDMVSKKFTYTIRSKGEHMNIHVTLRQEHAMNEIDEI